MTISIMAVADTYGVRIQPCQKCIIDKSFFKSSLCIYEESTISSRFIDAEIQGQNLNYVPKITASKCHLLRLPAIRSSSGSELCRVEVQSGFGYSSFDPGDDSLQINQPVINKKWTETPQRPLDYLQGRPPEHLDLTSVSSEDTYFMFVSASVNPH